VASAQQVSRKLNLKKYRGGNKPAAGLADILGVHPSLISVPPAVFSEQRACWLLFKQSSFVPQIFGTVVGK